MDASWTTGPILSLALLLAVAGVVKLGRPASAAAALRAAKLPAPELGVRALGGAEVALAVVVIVWGGPVAAAVLALTYLGFALFSQRLRSVQGRSASCGCFGASSAPVTGVHVGVNLVAAVLGAAGAAWAPAGLAAVVAAPGEGALLLAVAGTLAWGWFALLVLLPEVVVAMGALDEDRVAEARARG